MKLRRALWSVPAAAAAVVLLAAGCSDDDVVKAAPPTTVPGIAHPTGEGDVVLQLTVGGGFVPMEVAFGTVPSLTIYGDGTVISPGAVPAIYPGPMATPLFQRTISEAGMQAVLEAAEDAGLLQAPPSYESPQSQQVADAATTTLVINAAGGIWEHSAYALGIDAGGTPDTPARQSLADFVAKLGDLEALAGAGTLTPDQPYEPTAYRIRATANPQPPEDVEPTVLPWPGPSVDLAAAAQCAVAGGAAVPAIQAASQLTWFTQNAVTYSLAARPLLPGETGCPPA